MSETFFHLLGPGTQPNDDSFQHESTADHLSGE